MPIELRTISADETLPIRHAVLWPDKPVDFSRIEDDAEGWHLGGFLDNKLICVASVFFAGNVARLRKFATDPAYQSKGAGSAVLHHIIRHLERGQTTRFWCDARLSASDYYVRFGMKREGEVFYKEDIPYVKMALQFAPEEKIGQS